MHKILAIETSCDDTAASVIFDGQLLSNVVYSQDAHRIHGGVIPELASRKHHEKIVLVVAEAMDRAQLNNKDLDAIAVTSGPGLMGSLLVGCSFAKGMALGLGIPIVGINHMEAHVIANLIDDPKPKFPFLCLTVSGGHTQLVRVNTLSDMKVIGQTIDDAAGEAFDKIGHYLGLEYPAGPIIDKLSQKGVLKFKFTKPKVPNLNFSFSGLKTNVLYFLREAKSKNPSFIHQNLEDICASVQSTIVDILLDKLIEAQASEDIVDICLAGGVSANRGLRKKLQVLADKKGWNTFIPNIKYCTDNAAMIAIAGHYKFLANDFAPLTVSPFTRGSMNG